MARSKPTPPPSPPFPLLTIDGLYALLLRPLTNPLFTLLPPLVVLSMNPNPSTASFYYACVFTTITIILQLLAYVNGLVAGGRRRELDWTREVILITGGAGGLGRALAEYYGSIQRVSTAVVDVLPATEQRLSEWEAVGCQYYQCDISDYKAVLRLGNKVEDDFGAVSILIQAAGIVNSKSILDLNPEDVTRSVNVNLLGAVWCVKAFLPGMLQRKSGVGDSEDEPLEQSTSEKSGPSPGGTIVTVSSVLGYLGAAGLADYTASKAALTAFHESLKAEIALSNPGKRVNLILATPGQLSTPLFAHVPPPALAWFLGPTVTPALLAAEIIRAVEEGKDKEISTPLYAQWIGVLRILPGGLEKLLREAVGLDAAGWEGSKALREQRTRNREKT